MARGPHPAREDQLFSFILAFLTEIWPADKNSCPPLSYRLLIIDWFCQDFINFVSGNPFVEVTKGLLHLYKENQTTSLEEGVIRSQMICK
jgi:hypothetical protein